MAAGSPAFITVSTGASPTGFDALVVQNNNGGCRLVHPVPGHRGADGGGVGQLRWAKATSDTHVTLNLSATNPTAGDPVSDMRFSSDGTTYGAWVPFDATAPFTLPSGDGSKTVFVEYTERSRGGLGGGQPLHHPRHDPADHYQGPGPQFHDWPSGHHLSADLDHLVRDRRDRRDQQLRPGGER